MTRDEAIDAIGDFYFQWAAGADPNGIIPILDAREATIRADEREKALRVVLHGPRYEGPSQRELHALVDRLKQPAEEQK